MTCEIFVSLRVSPHVWASPLLFGVRLDLDGNGRDRNVVEIFDRWFWVGGSLEAVEMYGIVTWASMF